MGMNVPSAPPTAGSATFATERSAAPIMRPKLSGALKGESEKSASRERGSRTNPASQSFLSNRTIARKDSALIGYAKPESPRDLIWQHIGRTGVYHGHCPVGIDPVHNRRQKSGSVRMLLRPSICAALDAWTQA
jgi:hypothetical protein